jgi:hypothetical protein
MPTKHEAPQLRPRRVGPAGQRDAEMYALKRKLVMAEKARSEAAVRSQSEMRSMQVRGLCVYGTVLYGNLNWHHDAVPLIGDNRL